VVERIPFGREKSSPTILPSGFSLWFRENLSLPETDSPPPLKSPFRERLSTARRVLILGDNAGEIAFDKVLVGVLKDMGKDVLYCVKGGPVLNDATFEDARMVGTWLEDCSESFRRVFFSSDLVLSKGQANFETLDASGREVFHLLVAKCEPVALETGSDVGRFVLLLR